MLAALKNACRKVAERHASWLTAPLGLQRLPVHSGERQASFLALVPRKGIARRNRPWPLWSGIA